MWIWGGGWRATILSVSNDRSLLDSRTAVLQHAGYTVVATLDASSALRLISSQTHKFDVLIVGHSVTAEQRQQLAAAARSANAKVVVTYAGDEGRDTPADAYVEALSGPPKLLACLASVVRAGA